MNYGKRNFMVYNKQNIIEYQAGKWDSRTSIISASRDIMWYLKVSHRYTLDNSINSMIGRFDLEDLTRLKRGIL
jgi:hypothetical protein